MKAKKSWREKLADNKGLPRISEITGKMSKRWGGGQYGHPGATGGGRVDEKSAEREACHN